MSSEFSEVNKPTESDSLTGSKRSIESVSLTDLERPTEAKRPKKINKPIAKKVFFIDFQGYSFSSSNYVIKEIAILELNDEKPVTAVFKPPYDWNSLETTDKNLALFCRCYIHGFHWNTGAENYSDLKIFLEKVLVKKAVVYISGKEKINVFKQYTDVEYDIKDLYDFKWCKLDFICPDNQKETDNKNHCGQHDVVLNCSAKNTFFMRNVYYSE